MAQYEADKIIQLLQFCSWKAHTEMSHTGLHDLNAKLGALPDGNEQTPNEKYLVDLLDDAQKAIRQDNILTKRKTYIDLLLSFGGFTAWNDWKTALYAAGTYIQPANTDASPVSDTASGLGIWMPETLEKMLLAQLNNVKSSNFFPFNTLISKAESPVGHLRQLPAYLDDHAFIIAAVPLDWKLVPEELKTAEWPAMLQSGRIVPVWIDPNNAWDVRPPFIPGLKQTLVIGGLPGILAAILFLQEKLTDSDHSATTPFSPETREKSVIHNTNNNSSGIFFQGQGTFNNTVQNIDRQFIGKE